MPKVITPFLNYIDFLYSHQIKLINPKASGIISKYSACPEQQMKSALKPTPNHAVTFPEAFELSELEENVFSGLLRLFEVTKLNCYWLHKSLVGTKNGKEEKVYLLIFMCLAIRSIHIVQDMGSIPFLKAVIRFCNIYDVTAHNYRGNARSFNSDFGGDIIESLLNSNEFK